MAAIASAQSGAWDNSATWTGGTIPGNGDTVTISHAVTLADSRTIGTSPVAGTVVCLIASGGSLTIQSGGLLRLRGDLEARGAVTFDGGSGLIFDSTLAASPSATSYKTRCSSAVGAGVGRFVTAGTSSSSRVSISSDTTGGAANGLMASDSSRGYFALDYVDFTDVGTASTDAITAAVSSTSNRMAITNCTFTRCGTVGLSALTTDAVGRFEHLTFRNGVASGAFNLGVTSPIGAGVRTLKYLTLDQPFLKSGSSGALRDFEIDCVVCAQGWQFSSSSNASPASLTRCYFRLATDFGTNNVTWSAASVANSYVFFQNAGSSTNPHPCFFTTKNAVTVDGLVIEVGDTVSSSDGDLFNVPAPASAMSYTIQNCLAIPKGGDPTKHAGQFCSALGGANVSVTLAHNLWVTSVLGGENGAPSWGETYEGYAGIFASIRSNIAYGLGPGLGQIVTRRGLSTVSDGVAPGDCDYNCVKDPVSAAQPNGTYPGVPGHYDWAVAPPASAMFSSVGGLGSHNIVGDPDFVDPSRNIATWAASQGSLGATYAARAADAELYLLADPTKIDSLLDHVRGGWTPRNTALRNAGHDGATIGPVPGLYAASFTLSGPGSGVVGVASGAFTVTPDANYAGTVTPTDGGAGGAFDPPSLNWSGDSAAKSFTYTPATVGIKSIAITNSWGLTNPSPLAFDATSEATSSPLLRPPLFHLLAGASPAAALARRTR